MENLQVFGNILICVHVCLVMSNSYVTPRTVAHQAPLSMGFSRQKILEWAAISSSRGSS